MYTTIKRYTKFERLEHSFITLIPEKQYIPRLVLISLHSPLSTSDIARGLEHDQIQIMFGFPNDVREQELRKGIGDSARLARVINRTNVIYASSYENPIKAIQNNPIVYVFDTLGIRLLLMEMFWILLI